jgi:glycerol-3-phosphate dehydrogenase
VGVLGFGACGSAVASALLRTGFRVRAWSRSPRQATPAGCTLFSGDSNLEPFLREVEVRCPSIFSALHTKTRLAFATGPAGDSDRRSCGSS